jgi:hypothetical protein
MTLTHYLGLKKDNKRGSKFTLSEKGYVTSLTFYGKTGGGAKSPFVVKGTIYSDSSGAPNALLGTTQEITISRTLQWWTANFAPSISLSAGDYWLVLHNGTKVDGYYDTGATNQTAKNADTYSDGPADPFGTPTYTSRVFSIYANYVTWESYRDAAHTTVWGTVTNPYDSTYDTVYMFGQGFKSSQLYHVGFYDPSTAPNKIASTDPTSTAGGDLDTQYLLTTDPAAQAGTWHAVVYEDPNTPPTSYTAGDANAVADDDFEVAADAIPEFPTVIAGLAAVSLSAGIYLLMRRRMQYVKA